VPTEGGLASKLKLAKFKYDDSQLEDGSKHYYRLTAYNKKQIESDFSSALEGGTVARPAGLQVAGDMIREIHLQWHPSPFKAITGYRIYRHTEPDGTFQRIGQVQGKDKTSYIDKENLGDATTYFYRITVFDKDGRESGLSDTASAITRGKPPTPEGLTAQSGLVKKVSLSWKVRPEKEVEGYYLYWNSSPVGEFKQIAKIKGRDTTIYVDKGERDRPLGDNLTYHYMITSYNKVEVKSDPSAPANAITKPRPQQPDGLSAQSGLPGKVVLAWRPNSEKDVRYYHLWRQEPGKKFKELKKLSPEQTSYEDQKVDHGTAYNYRLQTEDEDKLLSDFSATAGATTKPLPQPPAGLEVKALRNGFELSWQSNPEPDIATYKIYLKSFMADKEIGSTEKVPFTISTLDGDKEYAVAITAVDKDGLESKKSATVKVRTLEEQ
jgi:fibronectin type 3 domain-containing protein